MHIDIARTPQELGQHAAAKIAQSIQSAIDDQGEARIVVSTGASQFKTLDALVQSDVDFTKVTMFHLDEYVGLPMTHPASFRKYLMERLIQKVSFKAYHLVDGTGNIPEHIQKLTVALWEKPIDVGIVGIGENGHIAFNDPPADFSSKEAYIVVDLDQRCRAQQVGEGWFPSLDNVPRQAITMTVHQIMQCRTIISAVPHTVKAEAVKNFIQQPIHPAYPCTQLKCHGDHHLFLDRQSASGFMTF